MHALACVGEARITRYRVVKHTGPALEPIASNVSLWILTLWFLPAFQMVSMEAQCSISFWGQCRSKLYCNWIWLSSLVALTKALSSRSEWSSLESPV